MELNHLNFIMNTPEVQSRIALSRIDEMLPYMERIGRLRHGAMLPMGADASQVKEGDHLWMPWSFEERNYFKRVRTIFGHARRTVMGNGGLRVQDKPHWSRGRKIEPPGKPEIDGLEFDETTTSWEWSAEEFQEFSQRLETLVFERFQVHIQSTVTCQTCGQSVSGRDLLTCGHGQYREVTGSALVHKPSGGTLEVTATIGYAGLKYEVGAKATKGVFTYDGLDLIISSLESFDQIAIDAENQGTPVYEIRETDAQP